MKDKANFSPFVIIAKCQVDWPGNALHKSINSINFGYSGGLITPPPSFTNISGTASANFESTASAACHPHFGPSPSADHKLSKVHEWRLDHDTEDCYPLQDLRRESAKRKKSQRGKAEAGVEICGEAGQM